MATIWTEAEYVRVALALRYPGYLPSLLGVGFSTEVLQLSRQLYVAVQQLPPDGKERALAIADQIQQLEDHYSGADGSGGDITVTKVDRIQLDPKLGLEVTEKRIDRLRGLLVALTGIQANTPLAQSGINASVCG